MLINKNSLTAVFTSLKTIFNNAFAAAPSTWQKIAMEVPSNSGQNDYSWLSNFPRMRRWVGAKVAKALEAYKYTLVNEDFEATVEVDRNHIEDDQLGIYKPQAQMAGWSSAQLPDELVYEVINGGFSRLTYDGQYHFDTDHPVGNGIASNRSTAPLSNANLAAATAGYGNGRTAMLKYEDDEGRSLNVMPNVLLVGPALEITAKALMNNDKLADGTPNPYKGTAEVVMDARIKSDTAWFLLDTSKPVKPFIYQPRKKPEFVQQISLDAPDVFNLKKYKFGAEARAAAGYGFWQLSFGSTGTGA
ncbi:Mu-like prophage major head subunit gpT [Pseudomonas sp. SLBN-26]|uniref:Mu-like prophage major head subunit gpT family protein n=1 Tax=Pseudomonadaceae TaxID=135621 RepID=UPI001150CA84|nr:MULTISPECIES: Mu-like prophage major head subunit gpT family protein [Pseudomonas]MCP1616576.1 phage major head subunit gpT-like protein [Pseudomonas otitidis]TQL05832.1 Mu-like prophage major head subunit gpT [Pseudomonas sp. SLBN-26]